MAIAFDNLRQLMIKSNHCKINAGISGEMHLGMQHFNLRRSRVSIATTTGRLLLVTRYRQSLVLTSGRSIMAECRIHHVSVCHQKQASLPTSVNTNANQEPCAMARPKALRRALVESGGF